MNDDELDRLIRAAHPTRTEPDAPLTAQQRVTLERIMATPSNAVTSSRRTTRRLLIALPAVAVVAAVVTFVAVSVLIPPRPSPAAAYGPPPLTWAPSSKSVAEVVAVAHQRLASAPGPTIALRESTSSSWSLAISEAGEPEQQIAIEPIETELTWNADLSGRRLTTAGKPFRADGVTGEIPTTDQTPGQVLADEEFGAGQYPAITPDAIELDSRGLTALVQVYAPASGLAGDAMVAVEDLSVEWTLTNRQEGYLLDILASYEGLRVEGTATDRLGRPVVGLSAESTISPGETFTLLISAATGRIVGIQVMVTGTTAPTPVPVGTVTSYALWKDTE